MSGQNIIEDINKISSELNVAFKKYAQRGKEYALCERDYKMILRQQALLLRDSNMAIGMINMTVYGVTEVAEARFKRDVAEANWLAAKEFINIKKKQLDLLKDIFKVEYLQNN